LSGAKIANGMNLHQIKTNPTEDGVVANAIVCVPFMMIGSALTENGKKLKGNI